MIVRDEQVLTVWTSKCGCDVDDVVWTPDCYEDMGTPICPECGDDMTYSHTDVNLDGDSIDNELKRLTGLTERMLMDMVESSDVESTHILGKAIEVNIFDYVELTIVDGKLTFLDNNGQHYSLYADCDLTDLIDLLN